jgi:hypothetical protein
MPLSPVRGLLSLESLCNRRLWTTPHSCVAGKNAETVTTTETAAKPSDPSFWRRHRADVGGYRIAAIASHTKNGLADPDTVL